MPSMISKIRRSWQGSYQLGRHAWNCQRRFLGSLIS